MAKRIGKYQDFEIYVSPKPAKTSKGKNRIYIFMKQKGKKWRIESSQSFTHEFRIRLEEK